MIKAATAYQKSDGIYIHSDSKSTVGVWVASPPYLKIGIRETPLTKGEAVLTALHASQESVAHPRQGEWQQVFEAMLQLAGARSLEEFEKDAILCGLEVDRPDLLSLIPHRKLGRDKGYEPLEGTALTVSLTSSPADIGTALEEAFRRCPVFTPGR